MPVPDRPQLRPYLSLHPDEVHPHSFVLIDHLRLTPYQMKVGSAQLRWLRLLDGTRTLQQLQEEASRQTGGQTVSLDVLGSLIERLDQALCLAGPCYQQRVTSRVLVPACSGT